MSRFCFRTGRVRAIRLVVLVAMAGVLAPRFARGTGGQSTPLPAQGRPEVRISRPPPVR